MNRIKYLAMAALVAFAACDEGEETVVTPPVTGSITGVVTIDGTGASGVTVSLSSGASATTDASGSYTFSGVDAGAYTVSISGFSSDATFSSTAQAATITTAGQVVNVNFSGAYVRTSAIIVSVTGGGVALEGVNVSIGSQSATTDAGGQASFSGLRADTYSVSISGFDASMYAFASTSQSVTLGVGAVEVVSFSGTLQSTAAIRGSLYLDENEKNNTFDSTEEKLAVAGVLISLEGGGVGNTFTTETDENGDYAFSDLVAGTYRIAIDGDDDDIPGNVALGDNDEVLVTVTTGAVGTANWPFDITAQAISVYAFLGQDGVAVGFAPIEDWDIDLYDTDENANAAGATGLLDSGTTDEMGGVTFHFDREDDLGPGGPVDNIVYARAMFPAPTGYKENGEQIIEIQYNAKDSLGMAPDTFDARTRTTVVQVTGLEIDGDPLELWKMQGQINDTVAGAINSATMDEDGLATFTLGLGGIAAAYGDTLYFRVRTAQTQNNGHGWKQTPAADMGMLAGKYVMYGYTGFAAPSDTVHIGTENVMYTDADITVRLHHELDDSETIGTFTADDNFNGIGNYEVDLFGPGAKVKATLPFLAAPAGEVTFANVATDSIYTLTANKLGGKTMLISPETVTADLDGSDQELYVNTLEGDAGESTFAHKFTNNWISGIIDAADGTPAKGLHVRVQYAPDNIGGFQDTTMTTSATGAFVTNNNLLDGPYWISVADSVTADGTVWSFFDTLMLASGPHPGTDDNLDERTGERDLDGASEEEIVRFRAVRMDREIAGTVINDRDNDGNVIDPDEALAGAELELVDADDEVVATATTNANGGYEFTSLREGTYTVRWVTGTPNATQDVLRALNTDSVIVVLPAAADVGTMTPAVLPGWNYATTAGTNLASTHFAFLFKNTSATGTITDGTDPVEGMVVSLRRCNASTGAVSPPAAVGPGVACTTYLGTTVNTSTDANGEFTFANLVEGVYEITPSPTTVGGFTVSTPAQRLYLTVGNGDIEDASFVAS